MQHELKSVADTGKVTGQTGMGRQCLSKMGTGVVGAPVRGSSLNDDWHVAHSDMQLALMFLTWSVCFCLSFDHNALKSWELI